MGVLKSIFLVILCFNCHTQKKSVLKQSSSVLFYQNIDGSIPIQSDLLDISFKNEINIDTISIEKFEHSIYIEKNEELFDSIFQLDLINGWSNTLKVDSIMTQDSGLVVLRTNKEEYLNSIKKCTKIAFLGHRLHGNIINLLIKVIYSPDVYFISEKLYFLNLKDYKIKSIIQLAYSLRSEDQVSEGITVKVEEEKYSFQETVLTSDSADPNNLIGSKKYVAKIFEINHSGHIVIL